MVTGVFDGLAITDRTSARDTLQTLLSVYFIDAVESDDRIKFVPRGQAVAAVIDEADLIPLSSGDSGSGGVLQLTRAQESDLPRQIDVTYISESNDWQSATQTARRMVTTSQQTATVSLALALTDDAAATFADTLLWQKWVERETFVFQLQRDWLWLEAADVISLTVRGITRRLRLTKTESTTLYVRCTAVQDDPFDITYSGVGSTPGGVTRVSRVLRTLAATTGLLLNLPALSDSHDDAGFYALASYVPTDGNRWPGAMLYGSTDGTAFGAMASLKGPAVYGICSTSLGDVVCPGRWDRGNSLTVVLGQGELASATMDAVLNGANLALVGAEILQFQSAALVAADTYTLSGLLRGRYGTEAATASHGSGEVFLLLSASAITRVATGRSWLGLERWYRAVTSGLALADADTLSFICRGAALKPWAPCHLKGARDDAGTLVITWVRRARLDAPWLDGTDAVPLCEDREAYDLDILDGAGAVRRTFTGLTSPSTIYTAAQQTTDFGAVQTVVRVRVFQISAAVGRGNPKEAVI